MSKKIEKDMKVGRVYRLAVVVGSLVLLVAFTLLIMGTLNSEEVDAQTGGANVPSKPYTVSIRLKPEASSKRGMPCALMSKPVISFLMAREIFRVFFQPA